MKTMTGLRIHIPTESHPDLQIRAWIADEFGHVENRLYQSLVHIWVVTARFQSESSDSAQRIAQTIFKTPDTNSSIM